MMPPPVLDAASNCTSSPIARAASSVRAYGVPYEIHNRIRAGFTRSSLQITQRGAQGRLCARVRCGALNAELEARSRG